MSNARPLPAVHGCNMKIVVCYDIDGGYDFSGVPRVLCFEYESTEAWLVDFESALNACKQSDWAEFDFCSQKFRVEDFCSNTLGKWSENSLPDVFELNEWFDQRVKDNNQ